MHVDMDGVLADFDRFVLEQIGSNSVPGEDKTMWEKMAEIPNFYSRFEPMSDMQELWDYVNTLGLEVQVLTAIPRRATIPTAEEDKRAWVDKHLGKDAVMKIGPYSHDKWKHAKPGDILIDDRPSNIKDWIEKGKGIGILHVNAKNTIEQLKTLLSEK